jgi:hypothetical protein
MKLKSLLLPGLFCCALSIGSACANPLTVYMSTHVTSVSDPAGVLSGILGAPIVVGQTAHGQYRYETTPSMPPPPAPPGPPMMQYFMNPGQGAIRISMGSLVLQSDPQVPFEVDVFQPNSQPGSPAGEMLIHSTTSVTPTLAIQDIRVDFQDPSGHWPSSSALPTDLPDLTRFSVATVSVSGVSSTTGAGNWSVTFAIDNVYLIPPSAAGWNISPATSVFSRQQNIDAALLLPAGSQVQSVQTIIGGNPGPFSFPFPPTNPTSGPQAPCAVLPGANAMSQVVVACPNLMSVLPDGLNQVEWQIQLMDGTTLDKVVVWEVTP